LLLTQSAGAFQVAATNIASAALLNLGTTPVQLVAAPGAGLVIVPLWFAGSLTFLTGAYTNAGNLQYEWGSSGATSITTVGGALIAAASQFASQSAGAQTTAARANYANQALNLLSSGAVAAGAGSFNVTVAYYIASV
jgi:hypothetical protein